MIDLLNVSTHLFKIFKNTIYFRSLDQSDFDFQEYISHMNLNRMDGKKELKGSAKKKTTSLDAVLSNMARHQKLDNMLDEKFDSL